MGTVHHLYYCTYLQFLSGSRFAWGREPLKVRKELQKIIGAPLCCRLKKSIKLIHTQGNNQLISSTPHIQYFIYPTIQQPNHSLRHTRYTVIIVVSPILYTGIKNYHILGV